MAKVITESQVRQILHDDYAVLDAVKNIFLEYIDGDAQMVSKVYLDISKGNDYRAMPAFNKKYACVKWIADYTSNVSNDFPTTQAIIILNDKNTIKKIKDGKYSYNDTQFLMNLETSLKKILLCVLL